MARTEALMGGCAPWNVFYFSTRSGVGRGGPSERGDGSSEAVPGSLSLHRVILFGASRPLVRVSLVTCGTTARPVLAVVASAGGKRRHTSHRCRAVARAVLRHAVRRAHESGSRHACGAICH